jgi:hypothetical protein
MTVDSISNLSEPMRWRRFVGYANQCGMSLAFQLKGPKVELMLNRSVKTWYKCTHEAN